MIKGNKTIIKNIIAIMRHNSCHKMVKPSVKMIDLNDGQ